MNEEKGKQMDNRELTIQCLTWQMGSSRGGTGKTVVELGSCVCVYFTTNKTLPISGNPAQAFSCKYGTYHESNK